MAGTPTKRKKAKSRTTPKKRKVGVAAIAQHKAKQSATRSPKQPKAASTAKRIVIDKAKAKAKKTAKTRSPKTKAAAKARPVKAKSAKAKPVKAKPVRAKLVKAKSAKRSQAKPKRETAKSQREREESRKRQIAAKRRKAARDEKLAAEAAHQEKLRRRRERYRQRQSEARRDLPDEIEVASGWLERIRNDIARVFAVSLVITEAGGGHADLDGGDAKLARRTPWMIVGRFDPKGEIGYAGLARGLSVVDHDHLLAASVNPQRLTQLRVVFSDPRSNRSEGDSVISSIGAYEFVWSDMIRDLVGSSLDSPDEESLAARYKESTVPTFYVFFSGVTTNYKDVSPGAKTQTVPMAWFAKFKK